MSLSQNLLSAGRYLSIDWSDKKAPPGGEGAESRSAGLSICSISLVFPFISPCGRGLNLGVANGSASDELVGLPPSA
jgi:hypothetical protein